MAPRADDALASDYSAAGFRGRVGFGERPVVLVVDVVRAYLDAGAPFTDTEGRFESARASSARIVDAARRAAVPVVFTRVSYLPGGLDATHFRRKVPGLAVFDGESPLGNFPAEPSPAKDELVITKQYPSAFFGTSLATTLHTWGVDTVVVVGFSTSGCVRASALDALQYGFRPIVVRDACGDRDASVHDANLFDLDAKYADVVGEAEALEAITGGTS